MDWLQHSVGSLVLKIDGTHQVNNMIPLKNNCTVRANFPELHIREDLFLFQMLIRSYLLVV